MTTIGLQHGLDPRPEGLARLALNGLRHDGPLLLHHSLQGVHTHIVGPTGLPLHHAQDALVKRIAIWA